MTRKQAGRKRFRYYDQAMAFCDFLFWERVWHCCWLDRSGFTVYYRKR